ncbi:hypothetical protein L873DRAFT_1804185 [Choiromyces venosus 120613-1]|uniref:Uncharacterized protein n=1 Tax=Choiromyces venosus 120613-1 TaxID=1336337 RepID=A0A3N4JUN3_9PEZI|nr:hypothetical protein L873DRAFT_1804185 [Choiromyces venosus 120613-1]
MMFRENFLSFKSSRSTGTSTCDTATSSRGMPVSPPREGQPPQTQPPIDPPRGAYLRKHHLQTYLIGLWILCIIAYIASIEKAIHAHQLSPAVEDLTAESLSFGLRGTRRRQETVQIFSFARTILTAIHIPIITATLSSTLPILTQRTKGRGTNINAEQLFLLADRTWAGAGGWYEAFRVRRLSWEWWKLTILVLACFAGFPFVTLGYIATSDQYWASYEFQGAHAFRFNQTVAAIRQSMISELSDWIHRFPQREIGLTRFQKTSTSFGPDGKTIYTFYPPADQTSKLGHFVTYLEPLDAEPRLVVANTMGMLQNLQCRTLERSEKPKYIDVSEAEWKCATDCANITDPISKKNMCHAQTSKGRPGGSGQFAQITSCGQPVSTFDGVTNKAILTKARIAEVEIAYKLDPPYESVSTSVFPPPQNAWSFRAGDNITADRYYVDILRCSAALIPGDGIVDSVIRRFMHFMPYGLGLAHEVPEVMAYLEQALPEMLNITLHPAISLLHSTFLTSNYGPGNNSGAFNNSLPAFFGLHRPTSESGRSTRALLSEVSAKTGYSSSDQFAIDNLVRLNGEKFTDTIISLANSSFISALPKFVIPARRPGFSYQTDVKLTRGIPVVIAPLVILLPVLLVFYLAVRQWNTPTWTEFLDSFAMFRLGRSWERELDGSGALELKECWQVRDIPGVVGDAETMKAREVMESSGREYVGEVKLGGEGELSPHVRYA